MRRRILLSLVGSATLYATRVVAGDQVRSHATNRVTLASAPIELQGVWPGSLPQSVFTVVSRMRDACLAGVRLVSDRQPERLLVEGRSSGPPHIWLHSDRGSFAWIVVDIGSRAWSQLAYQFGHEFGHVMCNLWQPDTHSPAACAWLEEALAEAFCLRGLGLLADSWSTNPPFAGDAAYGGAIRQYRDDLLARYRLAATEQGATADLTAWFRIHRNELAANGDIGGPASGAVAAVLHEITADPGGIQGLGGLYRWPDKSGMPMEEYLQRWERSCIELRCSSNLPVRLRGLLLG